MFGFFVNLSGLFSIFSAPFSAGASAAGALMQERARRQALRVMERDFSECGLAIPLDGLPPRDMIYLTAYRQWFRVIDGRPHIPRVEKRK